MEQSILLEIEQLERNIEIAGIPPEADDVEEWGGADVVIKSQLDSDTARWLRDQPTVLALQSTLPRRRAVITEYSKELSWLFCQLKRIFSGRLDYVSKYDFYGALAESAITYLAGNREPKDARGLLLTVLRASKGLAGE